MLEQFVSTVSETKCLPRQMVHVASCYLLFLTLTMKKHDFKTAAELFGKNMSAFSRLLNYQGHDDLARRLLNRLQRRRIAAIGKRTGVNLEDRIVVLIDATLIARYGDVENKGAYNCGKGSIQGHKFVNFVYLAPDLTLVPLASIPLYTKRYCRLHGKTLRTEAEIVADWIRDFPDAGLFAKDRMADVVFIMDAGYDVKAICNVVRSIGAHYVVALKCNRTINGQQVSAFFRRHRNLAWLPIRLTAGNGGRSSRRDYRVRLAEAVNLKGVGKINAVCSEMTRTKRKTRKYLASSDLMLSARNIVKAYRLRWSVELWHREIKQGFGFGECKCGRFAAIEAHVNFCLAAYCLHYLFSDGRDATKFTSTEYQQSLQMQEIATELTHYGARSRIRSIAAAAIQRMKAAA